ncbi:MAG TPA: ParB/RepB/Spo0J family partition protein [Acetobacteraceae bacterium]|nr:ParB/RepB/Spo0J family partition protein [Acetobacteraceae bacterium]
MTPKDPVRRLGKGLAALMGDNELPSKTTANATMLAVSMLEPGPFQPRRNMDETALAELAASLKQRGVLQPLLVRSHPGKAGSYQIIAGERRWRAAQQAVIYDVPVLVRELSDTDAMAAGLVENLQRQDLNPIEEAEGFKRLIEEFGLTQEALAEAVGKSRPHISNMMRLLNLPAGVRDHVRSGALSAGHARAILGHPHPEDAANSVMARQLSVRQTEALAAQAQKPNVNAAKSAPRSDSETEALAQSMSERLGLRVKIAFDGKGGTVSLTYRDLDQLDTIIGLLSRG